MESITLRLRVESGGGGESNEVHSLDGNGLD